MTHNDSLITIKTLGSQYSGDIFPCELKDQSVSPARPLYEHPVKGLARETTMIRGGKLQDECSIKKLGIALLHSYRIHYTDKTAGSA